MKEGRPSRTAQRVAMRRAAHQLVDEPRIFDDPLAMRIIGEDAAIQLRQNLANEDNKVARAMRAFMAVRSRLAEDMLALAVEHGVRQYVVLGAGLDTFGYRNRFQQLPVRVFEVDYPATQDWKRERLEETGIEIPKTLTFAPVDFEHQTLAEGLTAVDWKADQPTFFSWLGVTMYLTTEAIDSTLRFIASTPTGGGVAFDYSVRPSLLPMMHRAFYYYMATRVAAAGEPWRTSFDPAELIPHLGRLGFSRVDDATPEVINARYFAGRSDNLTNVGLAHIMVAWV